jgi:hypothetical protein
MATIIDMAHRPLPPFEDCWDEWEMHPLDHYCTETIAWEFCCVAERTFSTQVPRRLQAGPGPVWLLQASDELYVDVEVLHYAAFATEHNYAYFTYEVNFGSREADGRRIIRGDRYVLQVEAMEEAFKVGTEVARVVYGTALHIAAIGEHLRKKYGAFSDDD